MRRRGPPRDSCPIFGQNSGYIEVYESLARALIQSCQQGVKEAILPGKTDDEELPCLPWQWCGAW